MTNNYQSNNDNLNPEKIPGIEKEFTKPSGKLPLVSAVEAMGKIQLSEGLDCSEIAEDILAATGGEGEILHLEPVTGSKLSLLEEGQVRREFFYHEVYTDGRYVFDPRLNPQPVILEEWKILIRYLNPGVKI